MDFKTGIVMMLVGIAIIGFGSEVCAYTYETVSCGPNGIGASDFTKNAGQYDWSTTQWNYQGGELWWGYRDSSINGYHSHSDSAKGLYVCARAYNSHPKFASQPTKQCSKSGGTSSQSFSGWSSNMQSQQREVYCF